MDLGWLLINDSSFDFDFFDLWFYFNSGKEKANGMFGTYKKFQLVLYNCIKMGVHISDILHAVRVTHPIQERSFLTEIIPWINSQ